MPVDSVRERGRRASRVAIVSGVLALALAGCEKPVQKPQQGDMVVRDWIAAAASKDGQTYCALMTRRLLQSVTGQPMAKAKSTCEQQIAAGTGSYPFQFQIAKPTAGRTTARVAVSGNKLRGHLKLTKQGDKLLIDAVQ